MIFPLETSLVRRSQMLPENSKVQQWVHSIQGREAYKRALEKGGGADKYAFVKAKV